MNFEQKKTRALLLASLGLMFTWGLAVACGGFSGEETQVDAAADANRFEDADTVQEDADARPPLVTWRTPEKIFERITGDQSRVALRLGPIAGYYYSEAALNKPATISYATTLDGDGGTLFRYDGGPIAGESPSPVAIAAGSDLLIYNDAKGSIFAASFGESTGWGRPDRFVPIDAGADPTFYYPYMSPIATGGKTFGYLESNDHIVRVDMQFGIPSLLNQSVVTITNDDGAPADRPGRPVISRDDQTLYFAVPGALNTRAIWVATRLPNTSDGSMAHAFGNAHRAFPESNADEFPTDISEDGKTLYFTRILEGGSAVYRVTQN